MSQADTFGPGGLLEYNAEYKLMICCKCEYAIQKSALERHLRKRGIYRAIKDELLSIISQLQLVEPHEVLPPDASSGPIKTLPVLDGYCCAVAGCGRLATSTKRIRRHWNEAHRPMGSISSTASALSHYRPAKLQTFFRGNKTAYFEITVLDPAPLDPGTGADDDGSNIDMGGEECQLDYDIHSVQITDNEKPVATTPSLVERLSSATLSVPANLVVLGNESCPVIFDMESMTYFYQVVDCTSLCLSDEVWRKRVVQHALQHYALMCGVLAISSFHSAALAEVAEANADENCTLKRRTHVQRGEQYSSIYFARWEQMSNGDDAQYIGRQLGNVLNCIQLNGRIKSVLRQPGIGPVEELQSILRSICNCHDPENIQAKAQYLFYEPQATDLIDNCVAKSLKGLHSRIMNVLEKQSTTYDYIENAEVSTIIQTAIGNLISYHQSSFFACMSSSDGQAGIRFQAIAGWLDTVPQSFVLLHSRKHPATLAVITWAAVLVKQAERAGSWVLSGVAKHIINLIFEQLTIGGDHDFLKLIKEPDEIVNSGYI